MQSEKHFSRLYSESYCPNMCLFIKIIFAFRLPIIIPYICLFTIHPSVLCSICPLSEPFLILPFIPSCSHLFICHSSISPSCIHPSSHLWPPSNHPFLLPFSQLFICHSSISYPFGHLFSIIYPSLLQFIELSFIHLSILFSLLPSLSTIYLCSCSHQLESFIYLSIITPICLSSNYSSIYHASITLHVWNLTFIHPSFLFLHCVGYVFTHALMLNSNFLWNLFFA